MATSKFNPFVGQPIRSVQTYLRQIAHVYKTIPTVIPDGKFGEQTKASVLGFQKQFRLRETGMVDKETWDKIIIVYNDIIENEGQPIAANIFPEGLYSIFPGETNENLFVIQAMMHVICTKYNNMGQVTINGTNSEENLQSVIMFQKVFGINENGIIEKRFWDRLARLYEAR